MIKVILVLLGFCFVLPLAVAGKQKRTLASSEVKCSASGNGMDLDYIIKQIEAQKECPAAAYIAENCGFGSSADNAVTYAAITVCEKSTGKLTSADKALYSQMKGRCDKMCKPTEHGTECTSAMAFCRLKASRFIFDVNTYNR